MSSLLPHQSHTLRSIRQLPVQLANQIAAGEVIERPASVVKELVENSIDAGSSQIDITIERGGMQLIQVSDNGHGIATGELLMALAPHATSKVYNLEELNRILSLGFRGEALASIASVSRIDLQSRQADSSMGWMVTESNQEPQPCAISPGSRIAVRELFFNTPGRKRFLRSERTEFLQIEAMIRRLALSHFDIGFTLEHNSKSIFRLPPATTAEQQLQRIGQLFGKAFIDGALQIDFEAGGMRLSGWVGRPHYSVSQSDRQYFYLNGRGLRDKVISHAIRHVYQGAIAEGRYPAYLLKLQIDPEQVDVNVHPAKNEVRFRQGRMVHDFLVTSLLRAFEQGGVEHGVRPEAMAQEIGGLYAATGVGGSQPRPQIGENEVGYQHTSGGARAGPSRRSGGASFTVIASRFLLFVEKGEHYLCDLQSLYRRVMDESFSQLDSGEIGALASQPLLFPQIIPLSPEQLGQIEAASGELSRFGIVLEAVGEERVALRTLPRLLSGSDHPYFIRTLIEQWDSAPLPELLYRLISEAAYTHDVEVDISIDRLLEDSWLKRIGMTHIAQLVAARETLKLGSEELAGLFG